MPLQKPQPASLPLYCLKISKQQLCGQMCAHSIKNPALITAFYLYYCNGMIPVSWRDNFAKSQSWTIKVWGLSLSGFMKICSYVKNRRKERKSSSPRSINPVGIMTEAVESVCGIKSSAANPSLIPSPDKLFIKPPHCIVIPLVLSSWVSFTGNRRESKLSPEDKPAIRTGSSN